MNRDQIKDLFNQVNENGQGDARFEHVEKHLQENAVSFNPAWVALLEKAAETGMPRAFVGGLLHHDFKILHDPVFAPETFFWCLRETGTHLNETREDRREGLLFRWDGARLVELK